MPLPLVSVVIPCRDEWAYIQKCLTSLVEGTYPHDKLEILVVDGMSRDGTRVLIESSQKKYSCIRIINNPEKTTPFAKNKGVRAAKGEVILIAGAHAVYARNYISQCVKYLFEYQADNVGGGLQTLPAVPTPSAQAIALVLSSWFGAGNSRFRLGSKEPMWVDTVFGGCYRREVFDRIGLYNEKLERSQDMEFNMRLQKAGGKILLVPTITSVYYPKATLKEFFLHNIKDGIWAILPMKFGASLFRPRHLLPFFFFLSLTVCFFAALFSPFFLRLGLGMLGVYLFAALGVSIHIAFAQKNLLLLPFLMLAYVARHFGYGVGSFIGLLKMLR